MYLCELRSGKREEADAGYIEKLVSKQKAAPSLFMRCAVSSLFLRIISSMGLIDQPFDETFPQFKIELLFIPIYPSHYFGKFNTFS